MFSLTVVDLMLNYDA